MWFKESNTYFSKTENFAYGEINEQGSSNPHPAFSCVVYTDGLVQDCSISSALAMEILQSCTKLSIPSLSMNRRGNESRYQQMNKFSQTIPA